MSELWWFILGVVSTTILALAAYQYLIAPRWRQRLFLAWAAGWHGAKGCVDLRENPWHWTHE